MYMYIYVYIYIYWNHLTTSELFLHGSALFCPGCHPVKPGWGSGRRCSPTSECHCRWSLECPRPDSWHVFFVASETTLAIWYHIDDTSENLCECMWRHNSTYTVTQLSNSYWSTDFPTFITSVAWHWPAGNVPPRSQGAEQFQFFSFISSAIS